MANFYLNGWGITKSEIEAVKWYGKAAEQGNVDAQNMLGRCYEEGWGVSKNEIEAVKWYEKAVEYGLTEAQYNLGNCYFNGRGIKEDKYKAVEWYEKAAEQGFANALNMLGRCYENGWGMWFSNKRKALELYEQAANKNYPEALYRLSSCYFHGIGVEEDRLKATNLLKKASEMGYLQAREILNKNFDKDKNKLVFKEKEYSITGFIKFWVTDDKGERSLLSIAGLIMLICFGPIGWGMSILYYYGTIKEKRVY